MVFLMIALFLEIIEISKVSHDITEKMSHANKKLALTSTQMGKKIFKNCSSLNISTWVFDRKAYCVTLAGKVKHIISVAYVLEYVLKKYQSCHLVT